MGYCQTKCLLWVLALQWSGVALDKDQYPHKKSIAHSIRQHTVVWTFCTLSRLQNIFTKISLQLFFDQPHEIKRAAFENMLIVHRLLAQDRAMATARATGTARPPPPPPCPARPPRPCPCRPGATQERPVPSTSTPTGTFAPGSGRHPTPSTGRTTRWDWFDALLFLIFSVENYSFPSMSLIYIHILSYVKQKIMKW